MTLLASAGFVRGEVRNGLDRNLRWALFPQYEAICKSFYVLDSQKPGQDTETLLHDLKTPLPYVASTCVLAHRRAAEEATTADLLADFDPTYRAEKRFCKNEVRSRGDEACEIRSRRRAGEVFVRQAITRDACASTLRAGSGSGLCLSIPGIVGEEERWAPFISTVFFDPNTKPHESIGCFSPEQETSSGKVPEALAKLFAGDRTVASVIGRLTRAGFECGDTACWLRRFTLYVSHPAKDGKPGMTVLDEAPSIDIHSSPAGEVAELCLKRMIVIIKRRPRAGDL